MVTLSAGVNFPPFFDHFKRRKTQESAEEKMRQVIDQLKKIVSVGDPEMKYEGLEKIGQGASGIVFTATEITTRRKVAIKQMALEKQPKKDLIVNEIKVMRDFRHNNIVNFIDRWVLKFWLETAERSEAKSAKRSFASKYLKF